MDDIDLALYKENGRLNDPLGDYTSPKIGFKPEPRAKTLQEIQGDWPMKDYLPDDSGMNNGDLKKEGEQ